MQKNFYSLKIFLLKTPKYSNFKEKGSGSIGWKKKQTTKRTCLILILLKFFGAFVSIRDIPHH